MPASKFSQRMRALIAEECKIGNPDAVWCTNPSDGRMLVYFWTERLTRQELNRLTGHGTQGGALSMRGKVQRLLQDWNADGFLTKVCPRDAQPHDLSPMTALGQRSFCSEVECGAELTTGAEIFLGKCRVCHEK